ncbi:MAG: hypothetical protein JXA52_05195, partial [Planctomycetes bacterium]|nr:hypothetical protein [Planctomycetota bacterium]
MYLSDIYTISANLAGIPALSLPCGESGGMPIGVQIMAHHFEDAKLLAVAGALEAALGNANRVAAL